MTALEKVRKIRNMASRGICSNCGYGEGLHGTYTNQCPKNGEADPGEKQEWLDTVYDPESDYILTESEASALLTDEPSKTAEELVQQIWDECVTSPGAYVEFDNYGAAKLIQSALDAYAKAKVEEAADRYCAKCFTGPGSYCKSCEARAAILGREEAPHE